MKNGCAACGKRHGGRVPAHWMPIDIRNTETNELEECVAVCGWDCMTNWISKETKPMIDPTALELDIVQTAGQAGGEYLESIGKFDLSVLSENEWMTFLQCVIGKYQSDKIPF
jgi:hypothetical protein